MNVVFAGKKFTAADLRSIFKEPLKSTKKRTLEKIGCSVVFMKVAETAGQFMLYSSVK